METMKNEGQEKKWPISCPKVPDQPPMDVCKDQVGTWTPKESSVSFSVFPSDVPFKHIFTLHWLLSYDSQEELTTKIAKV